MVNQLRKEITMKDNEILANAIDKAIANGFVYTKQQREIFSQHLVLALFESSINPIVYGIIFSHSFSKAFWGESKEVRTKNGAYDVRDSMSLTCKSLEYAWEYHLQQMVIQEDPIKYLEAFL